MVLLILLGQQEAPAERYLVQVKSNLAPKMGRTNEIELNVQFSIKDLLKDGDVSASDCEAYLESNGFKKSTIKKS